MKILSACFAAILLMNASLYSSNAYAESARTSANHQRVIDKLFAKNAKLQAMKKADKGNDSASTKSKKISR